MNESKDLIPKKEPILLESALQNAIANSIMSQINLPRSPYETTGMIELLRGHLRSEMAYVLYLEENIKDGTIP